MTKRERGNIVINLSEKRLLDIEEFSIYASLGLVKAREVAKETGALFRAGKKVLVDRVKFDRWCDEHSEV